VCGEAETKQIILNITSFMQNKTEQVKGWRRSNSELPPEVTFLLRREVCVLKISYSTRLQLGRRASLIRIFDSTSLSHNVTAVPFRFLYFLEYFCRWPSPSFSFRVDCFFNIFCPWQDERDIFSLKKCGKCFPLRSVCVCAFTIVEDVVSYVYMCVWTFLIPKVLYASSHMESPKLIHRSKLASFSLELLSYSLSLSLCLELI